MTLDHTVPEFYILDGVGWKMIVGIIMRKDIALHAPWWTYTEGVFLKWWKSKLHCIWWFCCSQWHTHTLPPKINSLSKCVWCNFYPIAFFETEYSSDIMANGKLLKIMKHSDLYIIIFQFIEDRYPFDFCFCLCFLGFIMCLYLCFLCELMQFETKHSDLHKILSWSTYNKYSIMDI